MKIIKKYCEDSSRGREVGWGRVRPQTRYLNRTRTHPKPVQCCGWPPSILLIYFKASTLLLGIQFHETTGMLLHKTVMWQTKTVIRYKNNSVKLV